jgi:hypothetical protein
VKFTRPCHHLSPCCCIPVPARRPCAVRAVPCSEIMWRHDEPVSCHPEAQHGIGCGENAGLRIQNTNAIWRASLDEFPTSAAESRRRCGPLVRDRPSRPSNRDRRMLRRLRALLGTSRSIHWGHLTPECSQRKKCPMYRALGRKVKATDAIHGLLAYAAICILFVCQHELFEGFPGGLQPFNDHPGNPLHDFVT